MTRDEMKDRLKELQEIEFAIMKNGKSYTIGGQSLSRADLTDIRKAIADLERKLSGGSLGSFTRIIPMED